MAKIAEWSGAITFERGGSAEWRIELYEDRAVISLPRLIDDPHVLRILTEVSLAQGRGELYDWGGKPIPPTEAARRIMQGLADGPPRPN